MAKRDSVAKERGNKTETYIPNIYCGVNSIRYSDMTQKEYDSMSADIRGGYFHDNLNSDVWRETIQMVQESAWKFEYNEVQWHIETGNIDIGRYTDYKRREFIPRYNRKAGKIDTFSNIVIENNGSALKAKDQIAPEIIRLVEMGAIDRVGKLKDCLEKERRWYSPISAQPKKDGSIRPCIDASIPNQFARSKEFTCAYQDLTRVAYVFQNIEENSKIQVGDLTQYFHRFKLSEASRKLFSIVWDNEVYEFRVLPFGYTLSPFIAQYTHEVVETMLQLRYGIQTNVYLDDFLAIGDKRIIIECYKKHGLKIHPEKSTFDIRIDEEVEYLGVLVNLKYQYFRMRKDKAEKWINEIDEFKKIKNENWAKTEYCERFGTIVGKSTYYAICLRRENKAHSVSWLGRIAARWRQEGIRFADQTGRGINDEVFRHLEAWKYACLQRDRVYFAIETGERPDDWEGKEQIYYVDASNYGASVVRADLGKLWRYDFRETRFESEHINVKELYALAKALENTKNEDRIVKIMSDSKTAIAWVEKGTVENPIAESDAKIEIIRRIRQAKRARKVRLQYVNTSLNVADWFSRDMSQGEWEITQEGKRRMLGKLQWDSFDIDAMASSGNIVATEQITWEENLFEQAERLQESCNEKIWIFPPKELTLKAINFLATHLSTGEVATFIHRNKVSDVKTILKETRLEVMNDTDSIEIRLLNMQDRIYEIKTLREAELVAIHFSIDQREEAMDSE